MRVEIVVTYAKSTQLDVPPELAADSDGNYPDKAKLDEWLSDQADMLTANGEEASWVNTEVFETEHWHSIYEVS